MIITTYNYFFFYFNLLLGLADGKIRAAHTKSNKANTLYNTDSYAVALASNTDGTGFLSGHADGSIVRWYIADDQNSRPQVFETFFGNIIYYGFFFQ